MEIKKGNFVYKNLSLSSNSYCFLNKKDLLEYLRERKFTTNGEYGEQPISERLIFEDMHTKYSKWWFVEYIEGSPNKLVEISPVIIK